MESSKKIKENDPLLFIITKYLSENYQNETDLVIIINDLFFKEENLNLLYQVYFWLKQTRKTHIEIEKFVEFFNNGERNELKLFPELREKMDSLTQEEINIYLSEISIVETAPCKRCGSRKMIIVFTQKNRADEPLSSKSTCTGCGAVYLNI
jgi:hypothetical protein